MALIELQNVGKAYQIGKEKFAVLQDISLQINESEFVAIVGPSGSGKTTMMNILGLLDSPTSGEYLLDGLRTSQFNDGQLAELRNQKIGFIFQSFHLLPRMSALRNVEMPLVYSASYDKKYSKANSQQKALSALASVSLTDRIYHKPNEMSGGQRQRVAIARAIVNQPKIIFADEPTGNLDSATGKEILRIFEDLNAKGATIIMVTHDREIALRAKRIIQMLDGRIIGGTYAST